MAIYAVGCLSLTYKLCRFGLNLPCLSKGAIAQTGGAAKAFAESQATKMGLKKEIVVIHGGCKHSYNAFGNAWFSSKVSIGVPRDGIKKIWEFQITHAIAHIMANDHLINYGTALATTLFTTLVLAVNRDLFTRYLGGLGAGLIIFTILSRRAERRAEQAAMQHCSSEVNQACLDKLQEMKKKGNCWHPCCWAGRLQEPSLNERIGYFQKHLQLQKTV